MSEQAFEAAPVVHARALALQATSLLDAAYGCRVGGLNPVECAPVLLQVFPGTSAHDMAVALSRGWSGVMNAPTLNSALAAAGYSAADIAAAVAAVLHLNWLANASYSNQQLPLMPKVHALFQGDLTQLSAGEAVDFLVVSCLPGDYTPTPGSLLAALSAIGVSVAQLSANRAASYPQYSCWVSQPIQNQSFGQLIVFESSGQSAAAAVPGIFSALQQYWPNPHQGAAYPYADIAMPLVSTGSGGADPTAIMTATFNAAKAVLGGAYSLGCVRTVVFGSTLAQQMLPVFKGLAA